VEKGYRPHAPWHDRRPLPIWEVRPMSAAEPTVARRLYGLRREAERRFGNLVSFGGGLSPLPAWVRRLSRANIIHPPVQVSA
jgi:hypothetical protein